MPGKHAPASSRSFYMSLARALGAALGAVALMVIAVVVFLNRGDNKSEGSLPIVSSPSTRATSPSPAPTPTPTVSPSSSPKVLPPNQVKVAVLNGTTRPGLAKDTAKKIEDEGYEIVTVGNQRPTIAKSTIFYRPGRRKEALAFQEAFPEFTVLKEATLPSGTTLRVVIGGDYPSSA
jgi:LytR cell envelope-related transcriptional attenuator